MYPYGLIGNCQCSALVSERGNIDWLCLPRPDDPPVFGALLDEAGGNFSVEAAGFLSSTQRYLANTNVLETRVVTQTGEFLITDFFPRFEQFGRMFRPAFLMRKIEVVSGHPSLALRCRPVSGWDKSYVEPTRGNSHLRFDIRGDVLRLTTSMSLTLLVEGKTFVLGEALYFALTWSSGLEDDLKQVFEGFLLKTCDYWRTWVKHCSIPTLFQTDVIRSALALKLHCFEDTGAILAALTTGLPEERGAGRNWDYRHCWLRDSFYVLTAFHNLGHFEEMEGFLKFLVQVFHEHDELRPVYRIDHTLPLPEISHLNWRGYCDSAPVREGNQAAEHVQNDVYGEMLLAFVPIFLDERFSPLRTPGNIEIITRLARKCAAVLGQPDAGLWELRDGWREHSFTNLMSWAGLDRVLHLAQNGRFDALSSDALMKMRADAEARLGLSVIEGVMRNGPGDDSLESALLQLAHFRYPDHELTRATVQRIRDELAVPTSDGARNFLYRYRRADDFGNPHSAFLICSFWLVQALAKTGDLVGARLALKNTLAAANPLGLFSEHFDPLTNTQLGNFPQAYSHVGLINAAFSVSPQWDELL